MSLSSISISSSSQIVYDSQGVQLSTSSGCVFLSKSNISTITNNTSSLSIIFYGSPSTFTITSSQNYLITNIYNSLNNQSSQNQQDSDSD